MMQQTRVWRLLQGYRDRSAANLGVIADGLVRLSCKRASRPTLTGPQACFA
jgi:hypothetical protein